MDYYAQEQYIPQVTPDDIITGSVERWKAHREGILHRGYTIGLRYQDQILCQHRKHPVFNGFVDLTASSHQIFQEHDRLVPMETSLLGCLEREWRLSTDDLSSPFSFKGIAVYESTHDGFTEHEVCHYYEAELRRLPSFQPAFSYGMLLLPIDQLRTPSELPIHRALAPWVEAIRDQGLIG